MQNLTAAFKNLGLEEAIQAVIAFMMSWLAHLCEPGPAKKITLVLTIIVLLLQVRRGWLRSQKDKEELEITKIKKTIMRLKLKMGCEDESQQIRKRA